MRIPFLWRTIRKLRTSRVPTRACLLYIFLQVSGAVQVRQTHVCVCVYVCVCVCVCLGVFVLQAFPHPNVVLQFEGQRPAGFNRTWVRRTYQLGVLIGSAYFRPADRPAESPAVPSARRLGRPKVRFNPPPPLVLGPQARRYTQKAVHTQGGTHKRRSVATAGVTLLKGPQAKRYTQKAVHTQGGTHKRQSVATAGVMLLKGPQARRYTQKAVHTKGGTHKRRSVATAGVMLLKRPQAKRCTHKAEHPKGGLWPPQESCY